MTISKYGFLVYFTVITFSNNYFYPKLCSFENSLSNCQQNRQCLRRARLPKIATNNYFLNTHSLTHF